MNAKWLSALTLIVVWCGASVRLEAEARHVEDYCFEVLDALHEYHYRSKELNDAELFDGGLEGVRALFATHGVMWEVAGIHASNTSRTARMQFVAKMNAAIVRGAEVGISKEAIAIAAAKGLARAVHSSHTVFFSEDEAREATRHGDTLTRYLGIGARVIEIERMFFLTSLIPGGAAARSGIESLDRVVTVDDVVPRTLIDAKALIRGSSGDVRIGVMRKGVVMHYVVLREVKPFQDAWIELRMLEWNGKRVLYGRLHAFTMSDDTIAEAIIERVERECPDGIVIDLRENLGGSGDTLVALTSMFVAGEKEILTGDCPQRKDRVSLVTFDGVRGNRKAVRAPLRILVGEQTFSAGEVFAAAMQQLHRARIIGMTTPGGVEGLDNVALPSGSKLCVSITKVWVRGVVLEGRGVKPDLLVAMHAQDALLGRDSQLDAALDELAREHK